MSIPSLTLCLVLGCLGAIQGGKPVAHEPDSVDISTRRAHASAFATSRTHVSPMSGSILRGFAPPAQRWLAGHRGVDIAGEVGTVVVAPAAGSIHFIGRVGGTDVVSIEHGSGLVSTYQPVISELHLGDVVSAGESIGTLADSDHCRIRSCLHFGAKRGTDYVNPFTAFHLWPILLPLDNRR